jgi:hypothetical protein
MSDVIRGTAAIGPRAHNIGHVRLKMKPRKDSAKFSPYRQNRGYFY